MPRTSTCSSWSIPPRKASSICATASPSTTSAASPAKKATSSPKSPKHGPDWVGWAVLLAFRDDTCPLRGTLRLSLRPLRFKIFLNVPTPPLLHHRPHRLPRRRTRPPPAPPCQDPRGCPRPHRLHPAPRERPPHTRPRGPRPRSARDHATNKAEN